jgi:hypothetical protein
VLQTVIISELERSTVLMAEDCGSDQVNVDIVPKDTIFNKLNQTGVHGK